MTNANAPLHQRINWPDDLDMSAIALGIYTCLYWHFDIAGMGIGLIDEYYRQHHLSRSNDTDQRRAAMWYAVMRTAIETYGMKA